MGFIVPNFNPVMPEIIILVMGCLALLAEAFLGKRFKNIAFYVVVIALVAAAHVSLTHFDDKTTILFSGSFIEDKLAVLFKEFIYLTSFFTFAYSRFYVPERNMPPGEYYVLGLFSVLGMMILVSASSFITIYLGLELFSLPTYAMVALQRDSSVCSEAAMKYFIIGSIASGILLYGLSMIYGAIGSLNLEEIAVAIAKFSAQHQLLLAFGVVFLIVGVVFKLGGVPFHMWVPDVYEGAPSSVTLFLSAAPKIAALALTYRLLVEGMPTLVNQWQPILIVIAVLSMAVGNIAAIAQVNIKRMLAYSSIAHVGYALLGILAASHNGYASSVFYIISYALMTVGAFGIIVLMSKAGLEVQSIDDFKGLSRRNPWLAFMMLLIMFSMAGIPPLVGFMAKVGVLEAVIGAHMVWLAVLALLFAIIGSYYYIRVVKVMYFELPATNVAIQYSFDHKLVISINGLIVLLLGIFPSLLFAWSHIAI